jgi:hypothetical protein
VLVGEGLAYDRPVDAEPFDDRVGAALPTVVVNARDRARIDAVDAGICAVARGLDPDLSGPIAPIEPILARLDPAVATPRSLSDPQIDALVSFLRDALLDPRAKPHNLRRLVPDTLPSGREPLTFEFAGR